MSERGDDGEPSRVEIGYRVNMRHGVSRVRRRLRFTAGIMFHDAT